MIETPVLTITKKQIIGALIAVFLPALSWTGGDYVRTRDIARRADEKAAGLESDVRETRQDILRILVMMNKQFTGDDLEIARLTAELNALKAKEVKQ
jgi:hypothetical protein